MKTRPTIFISGVSHEFGSFRDAVENEIEMKGCFAENQPGFPPDYRTVEEMLRRKLHDADAVIYIVGFRFGAEPNQRPAGVPRRSYTQMEFDIARELQKPVYVFLSAEAGVRDEPKPDEKPEDAEAVALQLAHRDTFLKGDQLYYTFKDKAELCKLAAEIPPVAAADFRADISRIVKYAPTELIGREAETALLNDAWLKVRRAESPRPNILTFVALGGEGKTSLVAKWAADLAFQNWPGCDAVFAWSFYSQGTREQMAASSDTFLAEALKFFGDEAMAGSAAGAFDKGRRLAQLVGERRALLILDGLEPLQYAPTSPTAGELKDQGLAALLKGLAANSHGLCVVTTRYALPDLRAFIGKTVQEEKLTRLSTEAGVALLQSLGVRGSLRKTIPAEQPLWNEYEKLVEDVKGHALTLNLLGSFLRDAHAGDIRQRGLIKLAEADAEEQGGHAFRVMDAYVQSFESGGKTEEDQAKGRRALALLQLLSLFDRPATADCLQALWQPPAIAGLTEPLIGLSEAQRNLSLTRLEDAKLLTVNRVEGSGELIAFDAHPLLREYFARRVREQQPEAWRAAHRRLYEHLCATTSDKKPTPTLEDLQPLYQAVAHGCQAGLQQEAYGSVFLERIHRGDNRYSWRVLGAFGEDLGAVACFFDRAWDTVSPRLEKTSQIHLLRSAAFRLFATGRQFEALVPAEKGAQIARELEFWSEASSSFVNLAQIKLTLGEIAGSIKDAKAAVECADHDGVILNQMNRRAVFADVLHQAGEYGRAKEYFASADEIALHHMQLKVLGGLSGFRYSNLLLGETERAAWQTWIGAIESRRADPAADPRSTDTVALGRTFHDVERRASQSLDWFLNRDWHIDIALSHLTLGCIWLYCTILDLGTEDSFVLLRSSVKGKKAGHGLKLSSAHVHIDSAVDRLRRADQQQFLPLGLLTRAWFRFLSGVPINSDSAQSDLDEAWGIAERGSMKLFLADIHLYRARLFFREGAYPWQSPQADLAAAEKLINECGYHRRDEELADAKRAILG